LEGLLLGSLAGAGERKAEVDVDVVVVVVVERVRPREGARAAWDAIAKANSRLSPERTPDRSTNSASMAAGATLEGGGGGGGRRRLG
jgi:arginase family enzyme